MNFVNIQTPPGYTIDPKLRELVDKLALRNPTHTYSGKGMDEDKLRNNSGAHPRGTRGLALPREDKLRYLYRLNVHCGSELLGSINVEIRYGRHAGNELVYAISSWRIDNDRGTQNTSRTAKLDSALRLAKTALVPQNVNELMDKTDDATSAALMQALSDLKRPIAHSTLFRSNILLQQYVFYSLTGKEIPATIKEDVEKHLTSEKYADAMAEYELAQHMSHVVMRTVRAHNGGYLMRVDEPINQHVFERSVKYFTYDELPEKVQSNIAVLQLMQDGELVYDVGFRLNADCFAVPEN